MIALLRNVFAVAFLLLSSSALASETWTQGRVILRQCDYAFDYVAEVGLSYRNYTLQWGTSVELVYGWGGISWGYSTPNTPFDWANTQTIPVPASAPYTWSTTVTSVISTRSGSYSYDQINFVWKVTLPNGYVFYEKGNGSTWGFYAASLSAVQNRPCVNDGQFIGTPTPLVVTSVERW